MEADYDLIPGTAGGDNQSGLYFGNGRLLITGSQCAALLYLILLDGQFRSAIYLNVGKDIGILTLCCCLAHAALLLAHFL